MTLNYSPSYILNFYVVKNNSTVTENSIKLL